MGLSAASLAKISFTCTLFGRVPSDAEFHYKLLTTLFSLLRPQAMGIFSNLGHDSARSDNHRHHIDMGAGYRTAEMRKP